MVEFIERDLTGSRFKIVDLSGSRFSDLNLSGALFRGVSSAGCTSGRGGITVRLFVAGAFGAPMGVCKASARCCGYPLYAAGAHEQFAQHASSFSKTLAA